MGEIEVIGKFNAADVAQQKRDYQHERLRSAVVEAAQEWEHGTFFNLQDVDKRLDELSEAVRSLNAFETEHNLNSEV